MFVHIASRVRTPPSSASAHQHQNNTVAPVGHSFQSRLLRWHGWSVSAIDIFVTSIFSTVVMPSKRELCLVAKSDLQREFLARDVEELVSEIKENLRLKARPRRTQAQRPSPYKVERPPQRPEPPASTEDPYEMLQQLLESNSLVAEAVRRLQEGLGPKQRFLYDEEDEVALLTCPISI